MKEALDYMAVSVAAIKADPDLRQCFLRILNLGSMTQQVRVASLLTEIQKLGAPKEVTDFVRLLENDKMAHQILRALETP